MSLWNLTKSLSFDNRSKENGCPYNLNCKLSGLLSPFEEKITCYISETPVLPEEPLLPDTCPRSNSKNNETYWHIISKICWIIFG